MTIVIPTWLIWLAVSAAYFYGALCYGFLRALGGDSSGERPIVSFVIPLLWPFAAAWSLVSFLFSKEPS